MHYDGYLGTLPSRMHEPTSNDASRFFPPDLTWLPTLPVSSRLKLNVRLLLSPHWFSTVLLRAVLSGLWKTCRQEFVFSYQLLSVPAPLFRHSRRSLALLSQTPASEYRLPTHQKLLRRFVSAAPEAGNGTLLKEPHDVGRI
jgi:hypothetical protein